MALKMAMTFQDQIQTLKDRGMVIEDDQKAIDYLTKNNYYHLNKYFHEFIDITTDAYIPGTTFTQIMEINENDRVLRHFLFRLIDPIEAKLKAVVANYVGLAYGPKCFYDDTFSKDKKYWVSNFRQIMDGVFRDPSHPVVRWHIDNYDAEFPVWVLMEFATFNAVSKYFSNLIDKDSNNIGSLYYGGVPGWKLASWFKMIGLIRNKCAHGAHLFREKISSLPTLPNYYRTRISVQYHLFIVFIILKELSDPIDWAVVIDQLDKMDRQKSFLDDYGFPQD